MSASRKIELAKDIDFAGHLNHNRSVHLASSKADPKKKFIGKAIYLGPDYPQKKNLIESNLRKLYGNSQINLVKPEMYGFDDEKMYVYLFQPIFKTSLAQIITHHKKINRPIEPRLVYNFACKMYDLIVKMKKSGTDFFHRNLKPSNIFYHLKKAGDEEDEGKQVQWKITECGIMTNYPSRFYQKQMQDSFMGNKSNMSFTKDQSEGDLYSLGIILLEMITLAPIEKIFKNLMTERTFESLEQVNKNKNIYGTQILALIHQLLQPRDLKQAFSKFKQFPPQFTPPQEYKEIQWNYDKLENFMNEKIFDSTIETLKHNVADRGIKCEDIIHYAKKFDPELNFYFTEAEQLEMFLMNYDVNFSLSEKEKQIEGKEANPYRKLYELCFYLENCSTYNYMQLVKQAVPAKGILEAIIKEAIDNYKNRKEFFQAQTNGRQFWKSEDVYKFIINLGVFLDQKDVNEAVKEWANLSGAKRLSVRYEQFSKIFKDTGRQGLSSSRSRTNKTITSQKTLKDLLIDIKQKIPNENLVAFFRTFDTKGKWVVDQSIEKELKKYATASDKVFKELMEEMWQSPASIVAGKKKILKYIDLLKSKKIYDATEIFRFVLTEKINETNRQDLYRKYEKDDKGWTYISLMDFTNDEALDFNEIEMKRLFEELDKDKSQYLCQKQLIYQLTGLKQFDLEFLVEKIKIQISAKKLNLFKEFVEKDRHKSLCLSTPGDLAAVFIDIDLELPVNHYEQLFQKFLRGEKFDYLLFLRFFYELPELFIKACNLVIEEYYNGSFQKFYAIGLTHGRRKWNRNSLVKVNSDIVLCFTQNEIGEIWKNFDQSGDGSLTKNQVAQIFHCSYDDKEQDENFLPLNSTEQFLKTQKDTIKNKRSTEKSMEEAPSRNKTSDESDKSQLLKNIKKKDLYEVARFFIKKSRYIGAVSIDEFCDVLSDMKIPHLRNMVIKQTSKFQYIDSQTKSTKINFVSFLMFLCQEAQTADEKSDQEIEMKTQILFIVLRQIIKNDDITTDEIFKKCKDKTKMNLTDYQNFVKETLKVQIYFDDIEQTWRYFGDIKYIEPKTLEAAIKSRSLAHDSQPILNRQLSFQPNKQDAVKQTIGRKDSYEDGAQSPHFPRHMRSRRSSRDSKDLQPPKNGEKREIKPTPARFQEDNRQRESNRAVPPRSGRSVQQDERQQKREDRKQQKKNTRQQEKKPDKKITKQEALYKFTKKLQEKGLDRMNELFMKTNVVSTQKFINFLMDRYDLEEDEAIKAGQSISSFGKIKIENVRKYLPENKQSRQSSPVRQFKPQASERDTGNRKTTEKNKKEGSPQKGGKVKMLDPSSKLIDPRKTKLNIPLIKQHIRILINSFAKKYTVDKMQHFFFQGQNAITEDNFLEKCQEINSSISVNMYKKIFLYLKPTNNTISSISFKLNFSYDQEIEYDQTYLPEELESQMKAIFEKADKDKSGFVEINQVEILLSSLGLNETQKQIENYFEKIDQNFDKKISYQQFKIFLQENIIPYISDFDEDSDKLYQLLKMNDIFRTGTISVPVLGGVLEKYGVKINESELVVLSRFLGNQNGQIRINDLISALYFPSEPKFSAGLKSVLYKIRWKRKITFRQVQRIFESISSCFVISYTEDVMKKRILASSAFITPTLSDSQYFYQDFYYKNPISNLSLVQPNLRSTPDASDIIVQLRLLEASGLPIPQNANIKNTILSRSANITFYDTSSQQAKYCITTLYQIEFDSDIEDMWTFSKNFKSVFIKFAQYDMRKYEKVLLLIEFIVTVVNNQKQGAKALSISCGSCSIPLKQLIGIQGKVSRKYKITGGIPNKSRDIDKMSVSKRKGWRGLIKGEVDSELNLQVISSAKFPQKIGLLAAMPQKSIINRKSLDFFWTFREYFALKSTDGKRVNPDYCYHFLVKTFLLCLDIPDIAELAPILWKQTIEQKIKSFEERNIILNKLLSELFSIIHSKQFELLPSFPSKSTLANKSLRTLRQKFISDVFSNIENWVSSGVNKQYKRKKPYNCEYQAFMIEQKEISIQAKMIAEKLLIRT